MGPSCYIEYRGIRNRTIKGFYCTRGFTVHSVMPYAVSRPKWVDELILLQNSRSDENNKIMTWNLLCQHFALLLVTSTHFKWELPGNIVYIYIHVHVLVMPSDLRYDQVLLLLLHYFFRFECWLATANLCLACKSRMYTIHDHSLCQIIAWMCYKFFSAVMLKKHGILIKNLITG